MDFWEKEAATSKKYTVVVLLLDRNGNDKQVILKDGSALLKKILKYGFEYYVFGTLRVRLRSNCCVLVYVNSENIVHRYYKLSRRRKSQKHKKKHCMKNVKQVSILILICDECF